MIIALTIFITVSFLLWWMWSRRAYRKMQGDIDRLEGDLVYSIKEYDIYYLVDQRPWVGANGFKKISREKLCKEILSANMANRRSRLLIKNDQRSIYLKVWNAYEKEPTWLGLEKDA